MTIALLGVPTNSSGTTDGVAHAPQALRDAGLVPRLRRAGSVIDLGDVQVDEPSPVRGPDGIIDSANHATTLARVRTQIADARGDRRCLVVIGGDCPVLMGALAGSADTSGSLPGLLFVDGHEDAWPPAVSTTGEAADMELGLVLGRALDDVEPSLRALIPHLDPNRVAILGARDRREIDAAGVASIDGIVMLCDDAAVRADPAGVARDAARLVAAAAAGWWLHVDLDVLSTDALPAVDYHQAGGLSWSELAELTATALAVGRCLGATVTIYNPDLDPDRRHAPAIVELIGVVAEGLEAQA